MSRKPTEKGRRTAKSAKPARSASADISTGEATVATLLAHGMDTVYALPGVHNDHLFDAFARAGEALRVVQTRHEQGAGYMALGAALATGKPQAYSVVPGPGLLNSGAALLTAYGYAVPALSIRHADGTLNLTISKDTLGLTYALESSPSLSAGTWQNVSCSPLETTTTWATGLTPSPAATGGFYRVRVTPSASAVP